MKGLDLYVFIHGIWHSHQWDSRPYDLACPWLKARGHFIPMLFYFSYGCSLSTFFAKAGEYGLLKLFLLAWAMSTENPIQWAAGIIQWKIEPIRRGSKTSSRFVAGAQANRLTIKRFVAGAQANRLTIYETNQSTEPYIMSTGVK
jgi:hypothetical protein